MAYTVTISRDRYLQLLEKESANDFVCQQLKDVTEERHRFKSLWEGSQAVLGEVTDYVLELEADLDTERSKNYELEGVIKNLSDRVAKLNEMLFGKKKKKEDKEEGDSSEQLPEFGEQDLQDSMDKLRGLTKEANQERDIEKKKTQAIKDAEAASKKGTAGESHASRKNLGTIPVIDTNIYPTGYDPKIHQLIGKKIKYVLRVIPAQYYWERIISHVCKNRTDSPEISDKGNVESPSSNLISQSPYEESTKIYQASMPALPFPKAHVGADFIAWVIMLKFMFSLPEYRILRMLQQSAFDTLSSSTLNDWLRCAAEKLYPLYLQQWKLVLESDYIQVDEVNYRIADRPGEPARKGASFQVYDASGEGRGCFFVCDGGSRSADIAKKILFNYVGTVQVDAYAGYLWLHKNNDVTILACLAHILRKFRDCVDLYHEEEARPFYNAIQAMYGIDHTLQERGANYDTIKETRLKKTQPIFDKLVDCAKKMVIQVRPKSGFGRALTYFLENAEGIRNVFNDGRYYWDNNPIERRNRTTTLGRKNYLFAKNNDTAENLAIFYTFTETLMELGINAHEYLMHVLSLPLEKMKPEELRNELPYFYAQRQREAKPSIKALPYPA